MTAESFPVLVWAGDERFIPVEIRAGDGPTIVWFTEVEWTRLTGRLWLEEDVVDAVAA